MQGDNLDVIINKIEAHEKNISELQDTVKAHSLTLAVTTQLLESNFADVKSKLDQIQNGKSVHCIEQNSKIKEIEAKILLLEQKNAEESRQLHEYKISVWKIIAGIILAEIFAKYVPIP